MTNTDETLKILHIQLEHIASNNKNDENYEDQILDIENKIKKYEELKYYEQNINSSINNKKTYTYNGPVYRFGKYSGKSGTITTLAVSLIKAKSNIIFRIKKQMNLNNNTNLTIDENKIKEVI